ncbi:type IV pilus assembly protein PilM [Candidatus Parcubacteria bacterium]|nr:type IV pilus assembly protein PilM [Candidatus Parcubacteria bacterium]
MSLLGKKKIKNCLGVDIGTTSLKIVELSQSKGTKKLENYGEIPVEGIELYASKNNFEVRKDSSFFSSSTKQIAKAISILIQEAGFDSKKAVFSIPDFSTFFTSFDLPPMKEKEIPEAVKFQAAKYIPLPLSEIKIDWAIIEGTPGKKKGLFSKEIQGTKLKILLVTVPNDVIFKYQEIAEIAGLELLFLEAEVFSLVRSLIRNNKGVILLVDVGGRSTTCSVIENEILQSSHSFDVSGNEFTYALSRSLNVDYNEAERLKREIGIRKGTKEEEILYPLIGLILREIKKLSSQFSQPKSKGVLKIILAGGGALTPHLEEYFSEQLGVKTVTANPFLNIIYPFSLNEILKEMGPSYSIAVGSALKGLESVV